VAASIDQQAMRAYLAEQDDLVVAYLFGSVARGQANHLSDVDIAVLLDAELEMEAAVERQLQLMVAMDDMADREVQVTLLNHATPLLAYQVVREGILLYERSRQERIRFEVRVMKIYFDVKPMIDFHNRALLRRIQETGLDGRTRRDSATIEAAQRIHHRLGRVAGR